MSSINFIERAERYDLKLEDTSNCRITKLDGKSAAVYSGRLLNVSKSGLLFIVNEHTGFNMSDKLLIEFEIPNLKNTTICEVEISRLFTSSGNSYFGVRLLNPNAYVQDCIELGIKQSLVG